MNTQTIETPAEFIPVTVTRTFPVPAGYDKGSSLIVTATTRPTGQQSPYFSVTGEISNAHQCARKDCQACGCLHAEILHAWPAITPIVALHLSDCLTGEPMHAEANGFYWLEGAAGGFGSDYHGNTDSSAKTRQECLQILAERCRISLEEAEGYVRAVRDTYNDTNRTVELEPGSTIPDIRKAALAAAKADWKIICNDMRPRWSAEAAAGVALLCSL